LYAKSVRFTNKRILQRREFITISINVRKGWPRRGVHSIKPIRRVPFGGRRHRRGTGRILFFIVFLIHSSDTTRNIRRDDAPTGNNFGPVQTTVPYVHISRPSGTRGCVWMAENSGTYFTRTRPADGKRLTTAWTLV